MPCLTCLCCVQMSAKFGEGCLKAYFGVASRICPCSRKSVFILRNSAKTQKSFMNWVCCVNVIIVHYSDPDFFFLRAYNTGQFIFCERMKFWGFTIFWLIQLETRNRVWPQNFEYQRLFLEFNKVDANSCFTESILFSHAISSYLFSELI